MKKDKSFNWSDEEIMSLETRGNPDNAKLKKPKYKKSPANKKPLNNSKTQMLKQKNDQYEENSDSYDEDEDSGDDDIEIKIASNSDNKMYHDNTDEESAQDISLLVSGDESSLLKSKGKASK